MRNSLALAYVYVVFLVTMQNPAKGESGASAHFESSYVAEGKTLTLKLKKTFVSIGNGYGEKLEFSVYRAGKFLHAGVKEGGTVMGCRQPFTKPEERNPISKLEVNGTTKGWWISTMDGCGTRSMTLNVLLIPEEYVYLSRSFVSAGGVVARPRTGGGGLEVWYSRYLACGAGANSLVVPHIEGVESEVHLPSDFSAWPDQFRPNYQQAVLAGLADKNVEVLASAKLMLDEKTFKKDAPCIAEGVPETKNKLDELINALRVFQATNTSQYLGT